MQEGAVISSNKEPANEYPTELGQVHWGRDFKGALAEGERTGKPILVLFDEVPGCHTVQTYGRKVLSHPLIVEAAETLFVPVVVYNNVFTGPDTRIMAEFKEPTWNNPVVRIINPDKSARVPRISGDYSVGGLANAMVKSLQAPPMWLKILAGETKAKRDGTKDALFSMYCFWSGEASLGQIEGVVSTMPGFEGGKEVVQVTYDPTVINLDTLVSRAGNAGTHISSPGKMRPSLKDNKYHLAHTSWRQVPMTSLQATLANASVSRKQDPMGLFSPRQRQIHKALLANPDSSRPMHLGHGDLIEAWSRLQR